MNEPALLAVVRSVLQAEASPEELIQSLETTRAELEGQRQGFEAALARESPPVQQAVRAEVGAVHQSLEDYVLVLDSCGAYLQGFDSAYLDSTLEALPLAATRLDLDFLRFREAVMAQRGPTTHPGINQLLAAAEAGDDLELLLEFEHTRTHAALDHLASSEQHALSTSLRQFHQDYARVLASPPDPQWFAALEGLGERYARLDAEAVARQFADQPTPIPGLNLALNSAWLLSQDRVEPELCLYFLEMLLRQLASQEPQSVVMLRDWCEQLGKWLEEPTEKGFQPLVQAANAAAERYRVQQAKPRP